MTRIEIAEGRLKIEILGWDKLWSFKSRFDIPLENVVCVRGSDDAPTGGIRVCGTGFPGVISAGRYYQQGQWVFWDVHDKERAIVIDLQNEDYATLVLEVEDPDETARLIIRALKRF